VILLCDSGFVAAVAPDWSAQMTKGDHVGYVYCAAEQSDHLTPVLVDPCMKSRVGNLSCGQQLEAVAKLGTWLRVVTPDGILRFINSSAVSRMPNKLVPLDIQTGPAPECKTAELDRAKNHGPHPVFTPDPDYPERARRARKQGKRGTSVGGQHGWSSS
jgi:hypothetical protein